MEHSIKIDAEDVRNLYKVVNWIEEAYIESEWATNYLETFDQIREQIAKDEID